jgi:hypothetical protein
MAGQGGSKAGTESRSSFPDARSPNGRVGKTVAIVRERNRKVKVLEAFELTSGSFEFTDGLYVQRMARGVEQIGYAPILRLGKV